jgi:arginyl-tRNA synthetase
MRFNDYPIDKMIYVVGNEQNYHFQVLSILLDRSASSGARTSCTSPTAWWNCPTAR